MYKRQGLGRPFLYSNSCYGKDGVERAIDILKKEIEMSMKLLGVTSIKELTPELLDTSSLKIRSANLPHDILFDNLYQNPTYIKFLDGE